MDGLRGRNLPVVPGGGRHAFAFDPDSNGEVCEHAEEICARLTAGPMLCDATWREEKMALLRAWIDARMPG